VHVVDDEVGHAKVSVDQPVDLKVVIVFAKRVNQSLGYLIG
jgi:hypothetical protein